MSWNRQIIQFLIVASVYLAVCKTKMRSARKDGDIILGGLFPVHRPPHDTSRYTRSCGEIWEQYGIHRIEMLLLTLDEINSNSDLLPNITLGWDIRDSCWYSPIAMEQGIDFIKDSIASVDKSMMNDSVAKGCGRKRHNKPIAGLIGPGSSENTIQVQSMLQMFNIPQIGYSATSIDLSNKNLYKYFVRVVPSDNYQAQAMLDVVLRFNWTYVSTVHSDGNYGEKGFEVFRNLAQAQGICLARNEAAPGVEDPAGYDKIVRNLLKTNSSRVIVCLCEGMTVRRLLQATDRIPEANGYFQILASDGWADRPDVVEGIHKTAAGGISMKLMSNPIPSFDSYFRSLRPENNTRNPWFREYWQWKYNCFLDWLPVSEQNLSANNSCTGDEVVKDVKQDAKLEFVVKAVYALAYSLHNLHQDVCNGVPGVCPEMVPVAGEQFLNYLMNVSFNYSNGEMVFFDENGDPPPRYYIVNYQENHVYKTIGEWKSGELSMNDSDIYWRSGTVVKSVCSEECELGYVKKIHGNIRCCWVCTQCKENQIIPDSETCQSCEKGWWPNANLTECLKIPIEYITWSDTEAMVVLITASIGIFVTLWVTVVFIRHNNTPVVKASTRELSYIILFGVFMAYSSNYVLVAKPTLFTCYLTRILPGMSFSLIYGALVTKTNRIARILEGTKKIITKKPRFMSASAQVIITCILIGVECAIITIMLVIEPADCKLAYPEPRRVKLICNTTTLGIIVPLGFDLFLIVMCTLYAVKTRNLPENFNEAKFIGFSMYTTCVIWLGFIAIYFGSERQVITMSVSVSLSASVALVLLFFPKVYIIIWAPEKNTRSAFTTSKDVRCHIGSISCASGESIDLGRDKRYVDGFGQVPRRRSLLAKLKGSRSPNPPLNHRKNMTVPRVSATRLQRDNSFHVQANTASNSKPQSFSWAKMAANESSEDRLSTISSKDELDDLKDRRVSFEKQDFGSQTDADMLRSILRMPYLRRRNGKKIERSSAIDDEFMSVKFNPSDRFGYHRRLSSPINITRNGSKKKDIYGVGNCAKTSQERTKLLYPGYSDNPISTSDDLEHEEDFEYYDSISDLLQGNNTTPICAHDEGMTNYLNPLRAKQTNPDSNLETKVTVVNHVDDSSKRPCQLIVENKSDGTTTSLVKDPLLHNQNSSSVSLKDLNKSASANYHKSLSNNSLTRVHGADNNFQLCNNNSQYKRRASSPATPFVSCNSLLVNAVDQKRPSAFSQSSSSSKGDSSPGSFPCFKSTDDMTQRYIQTLDKEETSMLQFQTFMKERGVNLDMACIESSDV